MKKLFYKKSSIKSDFTKEEVKELFNALVKYYKKNKQECYDIIDEISVEPEEKAGEFMLMYKKTIWSFFRKKEIVAFKNQITRDYIFITI